ncbi:hypothetical protein HOLleu_21785 [Holothuria leucospilota]|uniref:Reverse transcriptase domain-containing protein n=1 Tax=Holothuria leucospilota TaxID=206669 RepID=A0A9Q1BY07_HOLLE|nr:hypothetical protein HOLleu_21785 [Holothuria leucospilota]
MPFSAVCRTREVGPLFRSSFFLAPKKRPIVILRPLNAAYIRLQRFRMETLAVSMWAASLDIKDAYLHIPIALASRRFLAYQYQGEMFKFTSLAFGLSTFPLGLHSGSRSSCPRTSYTQHTALCPPGRLDCPGGFGAAGEGQRRSKDHPTTPNRMRDQLGEVASHPRTIASLSRGYHEDPILTLQHGTSY